MNVLNLPSPTGGAEIGRAVGSGLGLLAGAEIQRRARNAALDYLNATNPPMPTDLPGTTYNAPKIYTQQEKERLISNAPLLIRNQVADAIEQRNTQGQVDIQRADMFSNLGEEALASVYPTATPFARQAFRNVALDMYSKGASPAQVQTFLTREGKTFADAAAAVEKSVENFDVDPFGALKNKLTGESITEEQLIKSLKPQLDAFKKYGMEDLARNLLSKKQLPPAAIEEALGTELSPQTLKAFQDTTKYPVKRDQFEAKPKNIADLQNSLTSIFAADPNVNLALLRKQYIENGKADYSSFRDAIADLQSQGRIRLNADQLNQFASLQGPEKNYVNKLLRFLTKQVQGISLKSLANIGQPGGLLRQAISPVLERVEPVRQEARPSAAAQEVESRPETVFRRTSPL